MNERIDELIVLAALGELTDAERIELDGAAAADPEVAAELAAELETAAGLLASTPVSAPSELRDRVLGDISATAQIPPVDDAGASSDATPQRPPSIGTPDGPGDSAEVVSLESVRRRRRRTFLSAAAALLIVGGAGWIVVSTGDDTDPVEQVAQAADAVERQFDGDLGGSLVLFHSPGEDAVAIEGEQIQAIGPESVYVLWTIGDDGATPVGEFRPDDDGVVEVRLDGVDPSGLQLGVTEESVDGYVEPTLPIRASA